MIGAEGLINDNGISTIALAFFTALFTALSAAVIGIYQIKQKAIEARDVALETQKQAEQARVNTEKVGDGFADRVGTDLTHIIRSQERLEKGLLDHLQWHLEKRE